MNRIIKHRKLFGVESSPPHFAGFDYGQSLSEMLESAPDAIDRKQIRALILQRMGASNVSVSNGQNGNNK